MGLSHGVEFLVLLVLRVAVGVSIMSLTNSLEITTASKYMGIQSPSKLDWKRKSADDRTAQEILT